MAPGKPLDERPTMSLPDACVALRIPHQLAQRWLYLGVLQGFRVGPRGGRWRVFADSVKEAQKLRQRTETAG